MALEEALARIDLQLPRFVSQLKEFVRIPSISTGDDPAAAAEVARAAAFLVEDLTRCGLTARTVQATVDSNPLVLAHPTALHPDRPTVLVYGHYDVQGVEPSAWHHDPFAAVEEDGHLIGRGASDDKGQLWAHLKAAETVLAVEGELPVNPVFLLEGEEECGSRGLARFLADGGLKPFGRILCTVISDTGMHGPGRPSLTLGLRGIVFTRMTVHGPTQDLHSGLFGGLVPNPNHLLVRALAALTDPAGRVLVPGFYAEVRTPSARERALYQALEGSAADLLAGLGVEPLAGEEGFSLLERRWIRPSLDVHCLAGGSPRTVVPAQASATLSCRLVPDQRPERIQAGLEEFLRAQVPRSARVEFGPSHTAAPYTLDLDHPLVEPARRALETGFGRKPVLVREGGSIPIAGDLASSTGAPVLLVGFGQLTDNWHGPNEHFSLADFHAGVRTAAALLYQLAETGRS